MFCDDDFGLADLDWDEVRELVDAFAGAIAFHGILRAGATPATVNARFTAKQLADSPTTMLVTVTPPVAVALANHPLSDEYHLWSLQGIIFRGRRGAAGVERMGGAPLRQVIASSSALKTRRGRRRTRRRSSA